MEPLLIVIEESNAQLACW